MAEDYTISPELLARVDEVIGWAIDSGMYVIMNIHWDGGWWDNFPTDKDECMKKYTRIWEQLSEYYGNYGDKLMFESLNEEGGWQSVWNRYSGTSGEDKEKSYALLNEINQKFVDIVRAGGENNAKRHLLIAGYNTDVELTCDELFVMPDDPAGRCAVSVHYYSPSTFCILERDADWGKAKKTWGTEREIAEMEQYMDMLKERFVDKGVPVIVGEYGCVAVKNKDAETIRRFNLIAAEEMYKRKMCPVLWDIKGLFYDRYFFTMKDEEFQKGLARIKNGESLIDELMIKKTDSAETAASDETEAAG
jgi:endoglucanase